VLVFGLGIAAMNNLDFDGGVLEALGRLLAGTVLLLISAFVPMVAFKFFGFLGEQTVESLHAGATAGVQRTKDVVGTMSPARVMERVNGHSAGGQSANGRGPSSNGSGSHAGQPATAQQRRYHDGRPPHGGSAGTAGAGARGGSAGAGAKGAASGGGAAAGGAAAGGVGAVVGASQTAADKTRSAGHQAAAMVAADDPYVYDPARTHRQRPPGQGTPRQT
jgi:hypothetical protein